MPEFYVIIAHKKYFSSQIFGGTCPPSPTPMLTRNINDITLSKKGSHDKQKLN